MLNILFYYLLACTRRLTLWQTAKKETGDAVISPVSFFSFKLGTAFRSLVIDSGQTAVRQSGQARHGPFRRQPRSVVSQRELRTGRHDRQILFLPQRQDNFGQQPARLILPTGLDQFDAGLHPQCRVRFGKKQAVIVFFGIMLIQSALPRPGRRQHPAAGRIQFLARQHGLFDNMHQRHRQFCPEPIDEQMRRIAGNRQQLRAHGRQ